MELGNNEGRGWWTMGFMPSINGVTCENDPEYVCNLRGTDHRYCRVPCTECNGSGRVPDVTTDKVLDIAESLGRPVLRKLLDGSWILDIWVTEKESISGSGETFELAACAALLAVKE